MLDIKLIREQPELVKAGIARRGDDPAIVDQILALDARRRELLNQVETLKATRNAVSKEISKMKEPAARDAKIAEMRGVGEQIAALDHEVAEVEREWQLQMLLAPNLPHPDVPSGTSEHDNVVERTAGTMPEFDFTPKPHWELGEALGI